MTTWQPRCLQLHLTKPWGDRTLLTAPCVGAEGSSFLAIWISFSCLFNHVITEERRKRLSHLLPLISHLKQQVALPQKKWQLGGLFFLLKLKHDYKSLSYEKPSCSELLPPCRRFPPRLQSYSPHTPPQAPHATKWSPPAALGCHRAATDRSLFSIITALYRERAQVKQCCCFP